MRYLVYSLVALGLAGCGSNSDDEITAASCAAEGKKFKPAVTAVGVTAAEAACEDLGIADLSVVAKTDNYTICWTYADKDAAKAGLIAQHTANDTALPASCPIDSQTAGTDKFDLLGTCPKVDATTSPVASALPKIDVFAAQEATTAVNSCSPAVVTGVTCAANWAVGCPSTKTCDVTTPSTEPTANTCAS